MSVKSKHSSSKKDKIGKKEKKKKLEDSDEDIESSEEELDLTKECHPIGYYMNDRAEMINQMFSVIKGNKLKAMLPPILKDCDLEQLKLQCLDQLLGMSEKRITCILEGETLDTSSESEVDESDEGNSDEKNGTSSGSSSDRSEDSQDEHYTNNVDNKHKKRKSDSASEGKSGKIPKNNSDTAPPEQGKTLLEILELEMRARAIRALLKQSGNDKGNEQNPDESKTEDTNKNGLVENAGDVVDLTECEDEEFPVRIKKEPEEVDIDKKVSTFEEKVEKSKTEKPSTSQEDEKSKRLQAELELRNKLFKKKIYRTRQQRMENDEEVDKSESVSEEKKTNEVSENVVIKQEPVEPEEVVVEDPEEGEVSTSEDEYPVEIKQEPIEPEEPERPEYTEDFSSKMDEDAERITAIDNGSFVKNCNVENRPDPDKGIMENEKPTEEIKAVGNESKENPEETINGKSENVLGKESQSNTEKQEEKETENLEETSWRDRWLQKDGVQKLVKSSKIYAKVKKRIAEKSQKAKEEQPTPYEVNSDSNSNSKMEVVEGSIEEYERLLGKQRGDSELNENGDSQQSTASQNELKEKPSSENT